MRILKNGLLSFLMLTHAFYGFGQTPENILDSISSGRKPEKIFTHFDKEFYLPGETLWFKAYVMVEGRPASLSTVARAELLASSGQVISSQLLPITIGTASGSMTLPADLQYGTYIFRLYTQQMLNMHDLNNQYYKLVPVLPSSSYFVSDTPVTDITLKFFPESGSFLGNELNILAFAAVDQMGRPVFTKGSIKDTQGNELASFATEFNGMGKVELTPETGKQYTAHYLLPDGSPRSVQLPVASEEGANLLVVDEVLKKRLIVNSRAINNSQHRPAYILGEMDQTVIFKIDVTKNASRFMGRVPVKDIPGGLLHIAVFNSDHKVLAERTCFVNSRRDTAAGILAPVFNVVARRSANKYEFSLPDSMDGTFSISVTDKSQTFLPIATDNILTATLVTSNLESKALNPLYAIGSLTGDEKNDAVDLLLLTHQYRWNWKQLEKLAATPLPAFNDNFIPLRGKAYSDRNKKPLSDANLHFVIHTKDSTSNFFTANTDATGYFETPGLFYEDTAMIYVKNNSEKDREKKVGLELQSPFLPNKYDWALPVDALTALVPPYLKATDQLKLKPVRAAAPPVDFDTTGKIMEEVVIQTRSKNAVQQLEKRYTKGLFSSSARSTIDFITDKPTYGGGNIFDYLKGRYSYLQVMGGYPNYMLVYRGMKNLGGSFITMAMFLDEMQVDASTLITVPMSDIAMVRIYSSGVMGVGGALAVYTKRGEDAGASSLYSYMINFKVPGFSPTRSFYSPDYSTLKTENVRQDLRKTIYWNPSLLYIPEDGKLPVVFYNNDRCTEYKIILQGFTTDGKLVFVEKTVK